MDDVFGNDSSDDEAANHLKSLPAAASKSSAEKLSKAERQQLSPAKVGEKEKPRKNSPTKKNADKKSLNVVASIESDTKVVFFYWIKFLDEIFVQ